MDPDFIRSVNPDPDSDSGSMRAKLTKKKKKSAFAVLDVLFLGTEGFSCSLNVLMEA
jgi:hypothetical protein